MGTAHAYGDGVLTQFNFVGMFWWAMPTTAGGFGRNLPHEQMNTNTAVPRVNPQLLVRWVCEATRTRDINRTRNFIKN